MSLSRLKLSSERPMLKEQPQRVAFLPNPKVETDSEVKPLSKSKRLQQI
jgi:hypothetical protein